MVKTPNRTPISENLGSHLGSASDLIPAHTHPGRHQMMAQMLPPRWEMQKGFQAPHFAWLRHCYQGHLGNELVEGFSVSFSLSHLLILPFTPILFRKTKVNTQIAVPAHFNSQQAGALWKGYYRTTSHETILCTSCWKMFRLLHWTCHPAISFFCLQNMGTS